MTSQEVANRYFWGPQANEKEDARPLPAFALFPAPQGFSIRPFFALPDPPLVLPAYHTDRQWPQIGGSQQPDEIPMSG